MTSLLRALSLCGPVLGLVCSMSVALTLARLSRRPRLRPARSRYAYGSI